MNTFFTPWPSLEAYAKIHSSQQFPGLFYYDYKPQAASSPGKPAIILIHGLGDEADTWRHIIPLLGAAAYRSLAPDLPGFGRSPCTGSSNIKHHSNAILELMESLSGTTSEVVLVGSSMGAVTAQAAALKCQNKAPKKNIIIKALVLIGGCIPIKASVSPRLLAMTLPFLGSKWYRSYRNKPQAAWESLFPYYKDIHSLSKTDQEFLQERVMDRVKCISQERAYFSALRSLLFQNLRSNYYMRIGKWPGKVSLIWGSNDVLFPPASTESFIKLRKDTNTDFTLISGAGHLPQQEKPDETAKVILSFLQGL